MANQLFEMPYRQSSLSFSRFHSLLPSRVFHSINLNLCITNYAWEVRYWLRLSDLGFYAPIPPDFRSLSLSASSECQGFTVTLCVLLCGVPLESLQHWSLSSQGLVGHRTTKHDDGTICVGCVCIGVGLCLSTTYVHSLLGYHVSVFHCIRVIRNVFMISLIVTLM